MLDPIYVSVKNDRFHLFNILEDQIIEEHGSSFMLHKKFTMGYSICLFKNSRVFITGGNDKVQPRSVAYEILYLK
jgi:hypothetical protein